MPHQVIFFRWIDHLVEAFEVKPHLPPLEYKVFRDFELTH